YVALLQRFNDQLLVRGWFALPMLELSQRYGVAKIASRGPLVAHYTDTVGKQQTKMLRLVKGEVVSQGKMASDRNATDINGVTYGLPGHETIFLNPRTIDQEFLTLQSLLDPRSANTRQFVTAGFGPLLPTFVKALLKTGGVRNGRLTPEFRSMLEARTLWHE